MTEKIAIALDRPALTAEVRAWISSRPGRPVLTRGRAAKGSRSELLLQIEVSARSRAEVSDQVESLMTDLRMLGLRPKLLSGNAA